MADSCDATEPFRSLVLRSLALLPPHVSELSHNDESLHLPRLAGTNVDTAVLGGLGTSIMQHPSFLRLISQAAPLNEWKRVVAANPGVRKFANHSAWRIAYCGCRGRQHRTEHAGRRLGTSLA